jgi:3-hydroxyisobutyrate dehydrogenase-like beta-hydroxyacid dehydrogenase
MNTQPNVGIIGLGIIGSRIAQNLRNKGFSVSVWNRSPKEEPNFTESPAALAGKCEIIQIFVANDAAVFETVAQLKPALTERHLLLLHSTISPETTLQVQEQLAATKTHLLDAPFTGSKGAAEKAELVYYVAGDKSDIERARPVLEATSKGMVLFDKVGDAAVVKLVTNMISAATVSVLSEAVALAESYGVDLHKLGEAISLNVHRSPLIDMKLPKIIDRDFETFFSISNMLKDSRLALAAARAKGVKLSLTSEVMTILARAESLNLGSQDFAAVSEVVRQRK